MAPTGKALDTFINGLELEHLQCRDYGHGWRSFSARWKPKERQYESVLVCTRCGTYRYRNLTKTGEQVGSHYDYPNGYLTQGFGRLTGSDRDKIRLASLLRVLETTTTEEGTA